MEEIEQNTEFVTRDKVNSFDVSVYDKALTLEITFSLPMRKCLFLK